MDIASEFVDSSFSLEEESFPTVILAIQGELVYSRDCLLHTKHSFLPFLTKKIPIKDYLQVHVSEVVLHIIPEMFESFLSELNSRKPLSKILSREFIEANMAGFSACERNHPCHPIEPEHKLDHAESEYNWSIAEPFFLTHQLSESDQHSYLVKPEYKDTDKFSRFDPEIYVYIKNWVESKDGKIDLAKIKAWKKILPTADENFMFSHCVPDKTEIKIYLCSRKDGRLIKITPERLMEIPLT